MKPITTCVLALSALTLFGLGSAARAQTTFFPNDATINNAITGDAEIGKDEDGNQSDSKGNPYNPTVNLVNGGSISGTINVWNSSVFNISGGSTGVSGDDDSVFTFGTSTTNITGGTIAGGVYAFQSSVVTFGGGSIPDGPSANGLTADGNSTINVTGGSNAIGLVAFAQSTINIRGGSQGPQLFVQDNAILNFFGSNLKARLISTIGDKTYALSGTLTDGTSLAGSKLYVSDSGSFTLNGLGFPPPDVPEPGSLALLCGLGVMGTGLLRRKHRR